MTCINDVRFIYDIVNRNGVTEIKNKFCTDLAELKIEQFLVNSNYQPDDQKYQSSILA